MKRHTVSAVSALFLALLSVAKLEAGDIADLMGTFFIENRGQAGPHVAYYLQGREVSAFFTREGVTFSLSGALTPTAGPQLATYRRREAPASRRWAVKLDFLGANHGARLHGRDRSTGIVSYFKGPAERWQVGLPTFRSVAYEDLWPGIDLEYTISGDGLKYSFLIAPGADAEQIRLAYRGAEVRLNQAGELEISTPHGGLRDAKPYAYQEQANGHREVAAAYRLEDDHEDGSVICRFELGPYDRAQPLVLDPVVVVYGGYIGGSGSERGEAIAVDGDGNAYVVGRTDSTEATFPASAGPDLSFNGGDPAVDAFVAKVKADGSGLIYAGYIGGSDGEWASGIAVDRHGRAYVIGTTSSSEATFPVKLGPDLTYNGSSDAFVARVNAAGTALEYAGYIGGSSSEQGHGIAVDDEGHAYLAGETHSDSSGFPLKVGPDLTANGGSEAFVAKLAADGSTFLYSGFFGGAAADEAHDIAVDQGGNAYITGLTHSAESQGFPVRKGPDLTHNGNTDAYVAKIRAGGVEHEYAGYLGGSGEDVARAIAVDSSGRAYLTGWTYSDQNTFPVSIGPDLTFNSPDTMDDAFIARVKSDGSGLEYAGYIGGAATDTGQDLALDSAGNVYVTGRTESSETTFPVKDGPDVTHNGGGDYDAYVAKVKSDGTGLVYAGYVGGLLEDFAHGIAVDHQGNAYITGSTESDQSTFPVKVGPDLTPYKDPDDGIDDAFVVKIGVVP